MPDRSDFLFKLIKVIIENNIITRYFYIMKCIVL